MFRARKEGNLQDGGSQPLFSFQLFFIFPMVIARFYAAFLRNGFGSADILPPFFRGIASDVVAGSVVGLLFIAIFRWRTVYYGAWVLWVLLASFNAEYVINKASNLNFRFSGLALSHDFVFGSVLITRNIIVFALCILASSLLYRGLRIINVKWRYLHAFGLIVVGLSFMLMPIRRAYPSWLQMNILEDGIRNVSALSTHSISPEVLNAELRQKYYGQDLQGKLFIESPSVRPNILLVIIESVNYDFSKSNTMPFFSKLHSEALSFKEFVGVQHYTNNGLYAILCGDYPNLILSESKSDFIANLGYRKLCLPEMLNLSGYNTVFMQSANLHYMMKDKFASLIGFKEVYGNSSYERAYSRTKWGVDDATLYDYAVGKIDDISKSEKPWFVTLLTAGSHHPFNVPGLKNPSSQDALKYSDNSLRRLIRVLENQEHLDDTLIIITSDEAGRSPGSDLDALLEFQHIPFVVLDPYNKARGELSGVFYQADIFLSVLDYLGFSSQEISGRSVFRRYGTGRHLLFGNSNSSRLFGLFPDSTIYLCGASMNLKLQCDAYTYSGTSLFESRFEPMKEDRARTIELQEVLAANEISPERFNSNVIMEEYGTQYKGTKWILGDQRLSAIAGDKIVWKLTMRADSDIEVSVHARVVKPRTVPVFVQSFSVRKGKTRSFSYVYDVPDDVVTLWSNIMVLAPSEGTYTVDELVIERHRDKRSYLAE